MNTPWDSMQGPACNKSRMNASEEDEQVHTHTHTHIHTYTVKNGTKRDANQADEATTVNNLLTTPSAKN